MLCRLRRTLPSPPGQHANERINVVADDQFLVVSTPRAYGASRNQSGTVMDDCNHAVVHMRRDVVQKADLRVHSEPLEASQLSRGSAFSITNIVSHIRTSV